MFHVQDSSIHNFSSSTFSIWFDPPPQPVPSPHPPLCSQLLPLSPSLMIKDWGGRKARKSAKPTVYLITVFPALSSDALWVRMRPYRYPGAMKMNALIPPSFLSSISISVFSSRIFFQLFVCVHFSGSIWWMDSPLQMYDFGGYFVREIICIKFSNCWYAKHKHTFDLDIWFDSFWKWFFRTAWRKKENFILYRYSAGREDSSVL